MAWVPEPAAGGLRVADSGSVSLAAGASIEPTVDGIICVASEERDLSGNGAQLEALRSDGATWVAIYTPPYAGCYPARPGGVRVYNAGSVAVQVHYVVLAP